MALRRTHASQLVGLISDFKACPRFHLAGAGAAMFLSLYIPAALVLAIFPALLAVPTCLRAFSLLRQCEQLRKMQVPDSLVSLTSFIESGRLADLLLQLDSLEGHTENAPAEDVTEAQLNALPIHRHRCCSHSFATHPQNHLHHEESEEQSAEEADGDEPLCTVCQCSFAEGAKVLTLPCCHQFHAGCIKPWLRLKGAAATCPNCKAGVFATAD